jgi:hypothetical protein
MRTVFRSDATEVLASPDFGVFPYIAGYQGLADRLKLDFGSIIWAMNHIPLCLDGADHAAQRADVARLIGERRNDLLACLPDMARQRLAGLSDPGAHDVMAEIVLPCVDTVIDALAGVTLDLPQDALVSRIFSRMMGVARRRRLEAELASVIAQIRDAYPQDPPLRIGSRVALVVLGRDALIGTLARSLHAHFLRAADQRLTDVPGRLSPSHTGVPYIDRQARCATQVGGQDVAEGEALRCVLKSLEDGPEAERMRFFGIGLHLCIGRAVALDLFAALAEVLALVPTRVTVTEFVLREDDVFAFPETFTIVVSA